MSLQACADLVARADPERFQAAMAAPVAARRVLLPLYAFNAEVARAPWVTEEAMIAEMRLQWWRDVLEEIAEGRAVRRHEVTTPLAEVLTPEIARDLDRLVEVRRWDIYKEAFEDAAHFQDYLTATGGGLMWAAAAALGAREVHRTEIVTLGGATALVRFLQAVPDLESRGRIPLVDGRAEAVAALAKQALDALPKDRDFASLPQAPRAALLESWQTEPLLRQIAREPQRVVEGRVGLSPFRSKLRLLRRA